MDHVYPLVRRRRLGCFPVSGCERGCASIHSRPCFRFSGSIPRRGIAGTHGHSIFSCLRTATPFSMAAAPASFPAECAGGSTLHVLPLAGFLLSDDNSRLQGRGRVLAVALMCVSLTSRDVGISSAGWPVVGLPWTDVGSSPPPIFESGCCFIVEI